MKNFFKFLFFLLVWPCVFTFAETHTPIDFKKCLKKANAGDVDAQVVIAKCYAAGDGGVKKSQKEAFRWYKKAAEKGDAVAMCELGNCYWKNNGVEKNLEEAIAWYEKSAGKGNVIAMYNLALLYKNDNFGKDPNWERCAFWWKSAARRGHTDSMFYVALCYQLGWGVYQNWELAIFWYVRAAKKGHEGAIRMLNELDKKNRLPAGTLNSLKSHSKQESSQKQNPDPKSKIDTDVPVTNYVAKNVLVYIIANEKYGKNGENDVAFALNDGKSFYQYMKKTLGVPAENIIDLANVNGEQMHMVLETMQKLAKKCPDSEIIFYYAGHAAPRDNANKVYLVPADRDVREEFELSQLYANFAEFGVPRITVFLDTCHSGSQQNEKTLVFDMHDFHVKTLSKKATGKMIIFSAASSKQTASVTRLYQHGLFTYCLLKKLQETKGDVSYRELAESLKKEVSILSLKSNLSDQDPTISWGEEFNLDWKLAKPVE